MISKEYKINTIQDILNVVNENNIDSFMIDFRDYIEMTFSMQKFINLLADEKNIADDVHQLNAEFNWCDDGKRAHKILLKQTSWKNGKNLI